MKKILCLLLSVCLVFSVVSFGASALAAKETEPETVYINLGSVDAVAFDPTTIIETTQNGSSTIPFYSNGTAQPFTFYAQLNANQKAVYDTILQNPLQTEYKITLAEPFTYVLPTSTNNMPQETQNALMAAAIGGLSALTDDHPEIFWINNFQISYGISRFTNADGTYTFRISNLSLGVDLTKTAYSSWDEVFSTYHEMLAAVEAFPVRGFTRYEKLKSMHDGIAKQVIYDPNLGVAGENPTDHEPTSVFLEPFTTVCEGYAEAFQLLCQREGIPCVTVVGTANGGGHAWNYVQMEDGVWYAVDLTWDDQDKTGDILGWFTDAKLLFWADNIQRISRTERAAFHYRFVCAFLPSAQPHRLLRGSERRQYRRGVQPFKKHADHRQEPNCGCRLYPAERLHFKCFRRYDRRHGFLFGQPGLRQLHACAPRRY